MKEQNIPPKLKEAVKALMALAPGQENKKVDPYKTYRYLVHNSIEDYMQHGKENLADFFYNCRAGMPESVPIKSFIEIFNRYIKDPNQLDSANRTFLTSLAHNIIWQLSPTISEPLIKNAVDNGADIDLEDVMGQSPLMISLIGDRPPEQNIEPFLKCGADPNKISTDKETPLTKLLKEEWD